MISIIMPVYNAEKFLSKALDSLISQTFSDIEIICVNDGSIDSSLEILEEYAKKDCRIKIFTQENSGPGTARQKALENSCGKYIMFCDADDWYEPTMCQEMYNVMENNDVDFAMCDVNIINEYDDMERLDDLSDYKFPFVGHVFLSSVNEKTKINDTLWSKIFKKSVIDQYRIYFPENSRHDDDIFMIQYLIVSQSLFFINKKLYNYFRRASNSIMADAMQYNGNNFEHVINLKNLYHSRIKNYNCKKSCEEFMFFYLLYFKNSYSILNSKYWENLFLDFKNFLISANVDTSIIPYSYIINNNYEILTEYFGIVNTEKSLKDAKRKLFNKKLAMYCTFGLIRGFRNSVENLKRKIATYERLVRL